MQPRFISLLKANIYDSLVNTFCSKNLGRCGSFALNLRAPIRLVGRLNCPKSFIRLFPTAPHSIERLYISTFCNYKKLTQLFGTPASGFVARLLTAFCRNLLVDQFFRKGFSRDVSKFVDWAFKSETLPPWKGSLANRPAEIFWTFYFLNIRFRLSRRSDQCLTL